MGSEHQSGPSAEAASRLPSVFLVGPPSLQHEGLKVVLKLAGFSVCGEITNLDDAAQLPAVHAASALWLIDVGRGDAIEAWRARLKLVRQHFAGARIVLLSDNLTAEWLMLGREVGVDGCLSKQREPSIFTRQLALIAAGVPLFPVELVRQRSHVDAANGSRSHGALSTPSVCQSDEEFLRYLVAGASNKMIGRALNLAESTVKMRIKSVFRKINASNRTEAAVWALKHGIQPPKTVGPQAGFPR